LALRKTTMKTNDMKTMTNLAIWDVHLADDEIRIWSRGASPTNVRPHKLRLLYPLRRAQDKPLPIKLLPTTGATVMKWGLTVQNTWFWVNSKGFQSERK